MALIARLFSSMPTSMATFLSVLVVSIGVTAPAAAQSSLELYQNRISALEEGLKDVRGMMETDIRAIKQALAEKSNGGGASSADIENKIAKMADQLNALANRIERTLEITSDNEFRLLRMEKRLDSLMRMGIEGDLTVSGPASNTGAGDVASSSLNANQSDNSNWTISADKLDDELAKLPNPEDAASDDAVVVEESDAAPAAPSILPDASPDEQFQFALGKALQNDLANAEIALNEFVGLNAEHERAHDAMFWLGRVQFMKGSYEQAAMTFTEFNTTWPTDSRREKTTLWIAESISYFAPSNEVCDLLTSLPNLIEDPTDNFFVRLDKLKQKSSCAN